MVNIELLSNFDLINICKLLKLNLIGVSAKDKIPEELENKGFYIINLNNQYQPGSHWTCFYILNKSVIYFDSFGEKAPIELYIILQKNKITNIYNNLDQIQYIKSTGCGYYCLSFIIYISSFKNTKFSIQNLEKFNKIFSDDEKKNDKILQTYIINFLYRKLNII